MRIIIKGETKKLVFETSDLSLLSFANALQEILELPEAQKIFEKYGLELVGIQDDFD